MILVIVESPYAGDVERNERYARACLADCLARGEAPFASHLLYTQPGVLDDTIPAERAKGISAGFAWRDVAAKTVVYTDLGISEGMRYGIADAVSIGHETEPRTIPGWAEELTIEELRNCLSAASLGNRPLDADDDKWDDRCDRLRARIRVAKSKANP